MGDGKDIEVNGKIIGESSKISLSVKTALWIIGAAITLCSALFTIAYFDVKSDVSNYKEKIDTEKQVFVKNVEDMISTKLDKQQGKDEEFIKDIEEIRGNIRLLLDRTQGARNNNEIAPSTATINNNIPTTLLPPKTNH